MPPELQEVRRGAGEMHGLRGGVQVPPERRAPTSPMSPADSPSFGSFLSGAEYAEAQTFRGKAQGSVSLVSTESRGAGGG